MEYPGRSSRRAFLFFATLALSGCSTPGRLFQSEQTDCSTGEPIRESDEWRLPRYDAQNTSRTTLAVDAGESLSERWFTELFERNQLSSEDLALPQVSTPVSADGQVYSSFVDPETKRVGIHAFAADSGREIWTRQLGEWGGAVPITTAVVRETVLVNVSTTDGWTLSAFNAADGSPLWQISSGSSASLIGSGIYILKEDSNGLGNDQTLTRVDSRTGNTCWSSEQGDGFYGLPAASDGQLGYPRVADKREGQVTESTVVAVSAEDGTHLWESRPLSGTIATPLVWSRSDSAFVAVSSENDVLRVSSETGKVKLVTSVSDVLETAAVHRTEPCALTSEHELVVNLTVAGNRGEAIATVDLDSGETSILEDGTGSQVTYSSPIVAENTILYTSYDDSTGTSTLTTTNAKTGVTRRIEVEGSTSLRPIFTEAGAVVFTTRGISTYEFD